MGNSKIWYLPNGGTWDVGADVESIDMGRQLTRLQAHPQVEAISSETMSGIEHTQAYNARMLVTMELARFPASDVALVRQLRTLESYLQHGGEISFALDSDDAWARYAAAPATRGQTAIGTQDTFWPHLAGSITAGDEVWLRAGGGGMVIRELRPVTSLTFGVLTITTGAVYDYTYGADMLITERDTWPALKLPIGDRNQQLLTTDHRVTYSWRATLIEALRS